MDQSFADIQHKEDAVILGYMGKRLNAIPLHRRSPEILKIVQECNSIFEELTEQPLILLAACALDLSAALSPRDIFFQFEALLVFRFGVLKHVFETLKHFQERLGEDIPILTEVFKLIEYYLIKEDVQAVEHMTSWMLFPPMLDQGHDLAQEWAAFQGILLQIVPKLCTKDLAKDKAYSVIEEVRRIWQNIAATSPRCVYFLKDG